MKKNNLIFLGLNTLLMATYLMYTKDMREIGIFAVLTIIVGISMLKNSEFTPASTAFPALLWVDAFTFWGVSFTYLGNCGKLGDYLIANWNGVLLTVFVVLFVLSLVFWKHQTASWMTAMSFFVMGLILLVQVEAKGDLAWAMDNWSSMPTTVIYVIGSVIWASVCWISNQFGQHMQSRNHWKTLTMLVLVVVVAIVNSCYRNFLNVPFVVFQTLIGNDWKLLAVLVVVLLGGAVGTYQFRQGKIGQDSLVLAGVAGAFVLYPICGMVFVLYILGTLWCVSSLLRGKKTAGITSLWFMVVQFLATILIAYSLDHGWWLNVVTAAVMCSVIYMIGTKGKSPKARDIAWLLTLVFIGLSTIFWLLECGLGLQQVLLVVVATLVALYVMSLLNWTHPAGVVAPIYLKVTTCSMLAVVCLCIILGYVWM